MSYELFYPIIAYQIVEPLFVSLLLISNENVHKVDAFVRS